MNNMRRGFTMIELIFVIVIIGILAAVAIPKLAATRDDAKAGTIKTDIGTAMNAVPSWYQGQKKIDLQQAMSIDTNVWKLSSGNCVATYTDGADDTVVLALKDQNGTNQLNGCPMDAADATDGVLLTVTLDNSNGGDIVDMLVSDLGVPTEQNVSVSGNKVKW